MFIVYGESILTGSVHLLAILFVALQTNSKAFRFSRKPAPSRFTCGITNKNGILFRMLIFVFVIPRRIELRFPG